MSGEVDSPFVDHDSVMIARAPIIRSQGRFTFTTAKYTGDLTDAEKKGPFNSHYVQARTNVYHRADMSWKHSEGHQRSHDGRSPSRTSTWERIM